MTLVCAAPEGWQRADKLALSALGVAVVGVLIAWRTLRQTNLNASVATASALMADIQISLNEYINSITTLPTQFSEEQQAPMTEKLELLMNRLEMASAICIERSLFGVSRTLTRNYVQDVLNVIVKNEYVCTEAGKLLQNKADFKYIRWFMGIAPKGSVTTPDGWYVRYKPSLIERLRVRLGWAS
jgi:hypothetical protein